jgi:arylformamidase
MEKLYDLTKELNSNTIVFPGDPCFQSETISDIGINSNVTLQKLQFCNHSGTHIDFPSHVIKNGKSSVLPPFVGHLKLDNY